MNHIIVVYSAPLSLTERFGGLSVSITAVPEAEGPGVVCHEVTLLSSGPAEEAAFYRVQDELEAAERAAEQAAVAARGPFETHLQGLQRRSLLELHTG